MIYIVTYKHLGWIKTLNLSAVSLLEAAKMFDRICPRWAKMIAIQEKEV